MRLFGFIKTLFLFIYLFSSSVFLHTQAMGIQADGKIEGDCAMNHDMKGEMKEIPANTNCYEKCLGAYDDFSSISNEEKTYTSKVFDCHYSPAIHISVTEVSKISVYSKLIDGGGICSPPFVDKYIKITKKLE